MKKKGLYAVINSQTWESLFARVGLIGILSVLLPIFFILIFTNTGYPDNKTMKLKDIINVSLGDLLKIEIVSASNKEEKIVDAPANIFAITHSEIMSRGYRTLMDIMRDLPGVTWTNTIGDDNNGTPVIRGFFGSKRLRLMINGMVVDPRNGFGTGWCDRFPVNGIERIEFIIGPYAALYGRNSFSGTINLITRSGEDINGGQLSLLYGKYSRQQASVIVGKKLAGFDIYLSMFKNYSRDGIDLVKEYPEEYSWENRMNKYIWGEPVSPGPSVSKSWFMPWDHDEFYLAVSHSSGLRFDLQANFAEYAKMGNTFTPLWYTSSREAIVNDNIINARLMYEFKASDKLSGATEISMQDFFYKGNTYYLSGNTKWYHQISKAYNFSQKLHYQVVNWNAIYFGASYEINHNGLMNTSFSADLPELDHETNKFLNITLQNEMKLFNHRMKIVAGMMYENSNIYKDVLIPRLAISYKITKSTTAKLMLSGGYITPDPIIKVDQVISDDPNDNIKGQSNIKPEKLTSFDLNIIQTLGENVRLVGSVFYNKITDIIRQVKDTNLEGNFANTWSNLGNSGSKGFDLTVYANMGGNFNFFSSYSYVSGYIQNYNEGVLTKVHRLPVSAKHHFKMGANLLLLKRKLNLYLHYLLLGDRYTLNNTWRGDGDNAYQFPCRDYTIDGYNIFDINLGTTSFFNKHWFFSLNIKNVFDKKAFDPTFVDYSISVYPPILRRSWSFQVDYRF